MNAKVSILVLMDSRIKIKYYYPIPSAPDIVSILVLMDSRIKIQLKLSMQGVIDQFQSLF